MTDELLAYLLDDLSAERRAEIERELASSPEWRRELERLQDCLAATGDPTQCIEEPPADLVTRTCSLVEHVEGCDCNSQDPERMLQTSSARISPLGLPVDQAVPAGRWSLADWSVGGGALLLLGCLLAPALLESRTAARGFTCQDNLRWLGTQLFDFQERWDQHLPPVEPGEHAGAYSTKLVELGGVDRGQLVRSLICPDSEMADDICSGRAVLVIPTRQELAEAQGLERMQLVTTSRGIYAIRLGRFDEQDFYHLARFTGCESQPLLADAPDFSRPGWSSSNHPGGQFVLYETLDVRFRTNCYRDGSGDNFYCNAAGNRSAACTPDDAVLSPGDSGPTGPMAPLALNE